jgi:hypothetical protein
MTWTAVNEQNKEDNEPIQIPASRVFTIGLNTTR